MAKKWVSLSLILVVLFVLPMQISAEEMEAEEILKKSNKAMMELDSYKIHTVSEMTDGSSEEAVKTEMSADVQNNPLVMHIQTMLDGETIESYLSEEGYFTEIPGEGWVKVTDGTMIKNAMMAQAQVDQAAGLAKDMSVEESDDGYVLTYEGDGQELLEMSMKMMESNMSSGEDSGEMQKMMEQLQDQMTINDVSYKITVDKENHYLTSVDMMIDMSLSMEGQTMNISQSSKTTVSEFNNVGTVEIPQEVINGAEPLEEAGGEMPDTATSEPAFTLLGAILALTAGGVLVFRRKQNA
ncbi:LPXTG cell wall anchor domain-containing protein [Halobacillus sp. ACCC02827]|uniref:LPXTG cell wall anchor domain-containing protein n=1 Tax=unclassified Halobacillus TaxID=2636472 RepID=UPI00078152D5|nr:MULTISPECIES: LPXTG cell wall anchor domain-containing protein [unclassified Halobacillus]WJE14226.1 LPXTG cell wall anchor domain-containing protein [Halobacillus sp. ACCC02827]